MSIIFNPFVNVENVADTVPLALNGAVDTISVEVNGTTFLYVTSLVDDGIQAFEMAANGTLTAVSQVLDDAALALDGALAIEKVTVGGNTFLIASGIFDNGFTVLQVNNDGTLTPTASVFDTTTTVIADILDITTVVSGGNTFVITASNDDDGLSSYQLSSSGLLTFADDVIDNTDYGLNGANEVESVQIGNRSFVVAGAVSDAGLNVFEIDSSGNFIDVQDINDDATLFLNGVNALEIAQINGQTLVYAGGDSDNGLSIFAMNSNGQLTNLQNQSFGSFGMSDIDIITINGANIAFITDYANNHRILAYEILSDGRVNYKDQVSDTTDPLFELNGLGRVRLVEINGNHFIVGAGDDDDGLSVFQIGGDDEALTGTSGDDIILGGAGEDDLLGLAGDDSLWGGDQQDILIGRNGDDLLAGGSGQDIIIGGRDFDTADYSESDAGVSVNLRAGTASGGHADGDILLQIEGLTGSDFADDLRGSGFHNEINSGLGDDFIIGDNGADTMRGGEGDDTMRGNNGADRMFGQAGDDNMQGGLGDDVVRGSTGRDTLNGNDGQDTVEGGDNQDSIKGGAGDDLLDGGTSHDTIAGEAGDDTIIGGSGRDVFVFKAGSGSDVIEDFQDGLDLIDLSSYAGITDFGDVSTFQLSGDTLVFLQNGDGIQLSNTDQNDLSAADFIFV